MMGDKKQRVRGDDPRIQKKHEERGRHGCRKLVLHGQNWWWRTNSSNVILHRPDGQKMVISLARFHGTTHHDIERRKWKQSVIPITPATIADFINRKLIGYTDMGGFPEGVQFTPSVAPDGFSSVDLERGTWHWSRIAINEVHLISPEGVRTEHRVYDVLCQLPDEWINARKAKVENFDDLSSEEKMHYLFEHRFDDEVEPTADDVRNFIRLKFLRLDRVNMIEGTDFTSGSDAWGVYDPAALAGDFGGKRAAEAIARARRSTILAL